MTKTKKDLFRKIANAVFLLLLISALVYALMPYVPEAEPETQEEITAEAHAYPFSPDEIPSFDGSSPFCTVNGNLPYFSTDDFEIKSFETYSELDLFGRCGPAFSLIGEDLMPTEPRGSIGMIRPSGWQTVKYDFIEDKYLFNRCHLIGYQLTGENDNEKNLITGTRYLNVDGMLPFENRVAFYIQSTGNHVLYRSTPVFYEDELVARGVLLEAESLEDQGKGVCFCVFLYNVQPGVEIDYLTGESAPSGNAPPASSQNKPENVTYILNVRSMRFHRPDCEQAQTIADHNRKETDLDRDTLIEQGFQPCGSCKP